MYKLLIVEDERWEREGLLDFLDWEALGITYMETACDGIEGLEKAMQTPFDIIITDIRMPGMDGLEMMRRIKEVQPQVQTIILTGYGDFEYAQRAIHYQANRYVLKPVHEADLLEAMTVVLKRCQQERESQAETEELRSEVLQQRKLAMEKWTADLIRGRLESSLLASVVKEAGFRSAEGVFLALAVAWPEQGNVRDAVAQVFDRPYLAIRDDLHGIWMIVLPVKQGEGEEMIGKRLVERLAWSMSLCREQDILIAAGRKVHHLMKISDSVEEAVRAFEYGSFWGQAGLLNHRVVEENRVRFQQEAGEFPHKGAGYCKRIIGAVHALDEELAITSLKEMFSYIATCRGAAVEYIRTFLNGLLFELTVLAGVEDMREQMIAERSKELQKWRSMREIEIHVMETMMFTLGVLQEKRGGKEEYIIRKVNRLIDQQYKSPDLCLKSMAEAVFLSPNYLGQLYKKVMGHPFHHHLTQIRMNQAKERLAISESKVSVIAKEVGIPNTSYFCTLFKQTYGLSPGEYQESIHR